MGQGTTFDALHVKAVGTNLSSTAASWPGLWRPVNSSDSRWPSPVITGGCGGPLHHNEPRCVVAVRIDACGQHFQPVQVGGLGTGNGG